MEQEHNEADGRTDVIFDEERQLGAQEHKDVSLEQADDAQNQNTMPQEGPMGWMESGTDGDDYAQNKNDEPAVDESASPKKHAGAKAGTRRANAQAGKERKTAYQIHKSELPLYSLNEVNVLEELSLRSRSSLSPESSMDLSVVDHQQPQQPVMIVRPWIDDPAMGGFNPLPQRKALHQTPCKRLARSKLPFTNMPDRMDQALIMIQNDINYLKKGNFAGSKLMQLNGGHNERKKTLLKQRSRSTEPVLVGRMNKLKSNAEGALRSSSRQSKGRRSVSPSRNGPRLNKMSEDGGVLANSQSLPSRDVSFDATKVRSVPVAIFSIISPEGGREKVSVPEKHRHLTRISVEAGKLPPLTRKTDKQAPYIPHANTPMEPYLQLLRKGQQSRAISGHSISFAP
mmetsp:Transcript_10835/g.24620  ORF Transcript_10835/g.24620 Transcript_10835/m.24620 type:complete len:399 (-) Transcript_10835:139-1335(-)|eukprot:753410-Hanusia_phi.AAC.11